MPIAGATPEFDITKISGGFHVYKMAPLPARYEKVIPTFFSNLNPKLVSTKCVPSSVIQNDLVGKLNVGMSQNIAVFAFGFRLLCTALEQCKVGPIFTGEKMVIHGHQALTMSFQRETLRSK